MENMREYDCWYLDKCEEPTCYMCNTYLQLKWQMNNSGLPEMLQTPIKMLIINKEDEKAYKQLAKIRKNIVEFVNEHKNLYIGSRNPGNGKTSWAVRMLQTYLHYTAQGNYENLKGMFVSVPDLLLRLKDFNNPIATGYKQSLQEVDLVVWDDIAIMNMSDYDYTQLYTIINNRMFAGKSNIFTSNRDTENDLMQVIGQRLTSRIWNTSEIITLVGKDTRWYGSTSNNQ